MKVIPGTILVLIGLVIGYWMHPMLNSSKSVIHEDYNPIETVETQIAKQTSIENSISPKESNLEIPEKLHQGQSIDQTIQVEPLEVTVYETKENEYIEPDSPELIELKDWTKTHKQELLKTLENHLPDKIKKIFTHLITKDNDFLDTPTLKQNPAFDDDWALMMEQKIRDLIQQNQLSTDLEIYSVTCKQLICEIFGTEHVPDSWIDILNSFFKNTELMALIDPNLVWGRTTLRGGNVYFYNTIGFKDVN